MENRCNVEASSSRLATVQAAAALASQPAAQAPDEPRRLALLRELGLLDSEPELSFDGLTRAASLIAGCPIALISLLDADRQWFKSRHGIRTAETPIAWSFCAHAALQSDLFEVEDTWADPRFAGNPLVTGEPGIRFYAGQPLVLDGVRLGTLCVVDMKPRRLAPPLRQALQGLAQAAVELIAARQARVALGRQQLRLAHIALASGDWLWESDAQGRLRWSSAHRTPVGMADPLALGTPLPDGPLLDARGEPLRPPATFHALLATHARFVRATLGRPTEAGTAYLSFSATPRFDPHGQWLGFSGTARDVSEAVGAERERYAADLALRLERDAARQTARMRSEVVSRASHEMRTPLNAMIGFAQLIVRDPGDSSLYATHVLRAGKHLLALVNDMLDLARLESGHATLDLVAVPVPSVIQRCVELLQPDAERRGVTLMVRVEPGLPAVVADVRGLTQALLNLMDNALKFSPCGGTVRIDARCEPGDDGVLISVTDEGVGIPPGQLERLFQPFSQLPGGQQHGGTGLGLSISRQLVRSFGGDISVACGPGTGSVFSIRVRVANASMPAMPDSGLVPLEVAEMSAARDPLQVLYIEDEPVNMLVLRHMLAHLGNVDLHEATTAAQGVSKARALDLDVILLDMNLPDGHGLEWAAILRAEARTANVPIVALSADAMPEAIARASAAGFDDYLTKPVDLERLSALLLRLQTT